MKKRVRVMQFGSSNSLLGAERWIIALVKHSDPRQVEHIVGTVKDSVTTRTDLVQSAGKLGFKTSLFQARGAYDPLVIWRIVSVIREYSIDILHTHGYKSDILGFISAKISGIPIISTPHGWSKEKDIKLKMYERLSRFFLRYFDNVVPLSRELYDGLIKDGVRKEKVRLIRNGFDVSELDDAIIKKREKAGKQSPRYKTIGYIGQLITRKNVDILIKAINLIKDKHMCRLLIIGDGPERNKLEDLCSKLGIKDMVTFTGFRDDRLDLLLSLDIFVLPSKLEGIPRSLMEAMAAEVPVIGSDIPGTRDLIGANEYGLVVPPDDSEKLAEKMAYMLRNYDMSKKLAKKAREMVISRHSAERMAEEYCSLYFELI